MEKRLEGIEIIAWLLILNSAICICFWLIARICDAFFYGFIMKWSTLFLLFGLLISGIGGIELFSLTRSSRILTLIGAVFLFLSLLHTAVNYFIAGGFSSFGLEELYQCGGLISPFVLFYLTRPKAKEQFK